MATRVLPGDRILFHVMEDARVASDEAEVRSVADHLRSRWQPDRDGAARDQRAEWPLQLVATRERIEQEGSSSTLGEKAQRKPAERLGRVVGRQPPAGEGGRVVHAGGEDSLVVAGESEERRPGSVVQNRPDGPAA